MAAARRWLATPEFSVLLVLAALLVFLAARGRLDDFSVERLMRFLTALHRDIRIVVDEKPRRDRGRMIVEAA